MSYILDALRRADAQRASGLAAAATPHGNALVNPAPEMQRPAHGWPRAALAGLALVALVALSLLVALGWRLGQPRAPAVADPPVALAAAPRLSTVAPAASVTPAAFDAQTSAAPPPAPASATKNAAARIKSTPTPRQKEAEKPAAAGSTDGALPAAPPAGLAPLKINGATYSANPAHRLLIVNGQVLKEGQPVADGVVLRRVGPRQAEFEYNGSRFSIAY